MTYLSKLHDISHCKVKCTYVDFNHSIVCKHKSFSFLFNFSCICLYYLKNHQRTETNPPTQNGKKWKKHFWLEELLNSTVLIKKAPSYYYKTRNYSNVKEKFTSSNNNYPFQKVKKHTNVLSQKRKSNGKTTYTGFRK